MTKLRMVAGFLFWERRVLLVQKQKPKWQAGLWNAVGGKCEDGETSRAAMVREFEEETGYLETAWNHFCTEIGPDYLVDFYRSNLKQERSEWPACNDAGEPLAWSHTEEPRVIGNLHWLIPLALDPRGVKHPVIVRPIDDIKERATW